MESKVTLLCLFACKMCGKGTFSQIRSHMSYTESLTQALQARALDIVQAVHHIGVLKQVY